MLSLSQPILKALRTPAIALLAAAILLTLYSSLASAPQAADTASESQRLNSIMARHDHDMSQWINSLADTLSNPNTQTFPQHLSQSDYSLYLFDNNNLRLWHNACLPNPDLQPSTLNRSILTADNGWYYIKSLHRDTTHIYALLQLRSHSPYDNEYLADRFHPSLAINDDAHLSATPTNGVNVSDTNGHFLFSITGDTATHLSPTITVISIALLFITLALTIWAISSATLRIAHLTHRHWQPLALSAIMLATLYMASLLITPPGGDDSSIFFSPLVFSYDWWLPSLGYLLLASLLLLTWSVMFLRLTKVRTRRRLAICLAALMPTLFFLILSSAIELMARHSQGLAFYVGYLSLSSDSLAKIAILSLLIMSLVLIIERCYSSLNGNLSSAGFSLLLIGTALPILLIAHLSEWTQPWSHTLAYIAIGTIYYIMKRRSPNVLQFSHFVWTMMLMALLTTLRLTMLNADKEMSYRKLLSVNLSVQIMRDDDPVAEQQLPLVQSTLMADTAVRQMMSEPTIRQDQLFGHLRGAIFGGYFTRYDLQVVPCRGTGSTIQMTNTGDVYDCAQYFEQLIYCHGIQVPNARNFHCISNGDGQPCYLGVFNLGSPDNPNNLFVQITRKVSAQGVGYPELLTNKRDRMDEDRLRGYSYARYANRHLISRYGSYDYPTTLASSDSTTSIIQTNGYSHLSTAPSHNQTIVVSYPLMTAQDLMTTYSYIFLGMLIVCSVIMILAIHPDKSIWRHSSLSERLHACLVAFVLVLFVILCLISSLQSINTFETKSRSHLSEAMQSVLLSLSDLFADASPDDVAKDTHNFQTDNILQRTSDAFNADAHLFSANGILLGTSRRELFMSGTTAPLMNDEALAIMRSDSRGEVFVQERIGSLLHYSIYSPLFNNRGNVLGYVNVPYFNDVSAMRRQMMQTLMPITNSMMLIIFLAIVFSYLMAYGVTRSLGQLRDMLQSADIGQEHHRLSYPYQDEVGEIVKAYNKMTRQLELSASRLAASERESTWREMARQVAHEIKNPLTPMKLSVQYLLRSWDTRRDNFEPMLKKTSQTLIDQIDQLAAVASQFSGIAKMKQAEPQRMDIAARLTSICTLFARDEESNLSYSGPNSDIFIMADPDLITSVFNNLIKNAQQSTANHRTVDISVTLTPEPHNARITVTDNGDGIDDNIRDKIFRPNFTTKSSGMGLGLAISKTIIDNSHGSISFSTHHNSGTTFTILLPRIPN